MAQKSESIDTDSASGQSEIPNGSASELQNAIASAGISNQSPALRPVVIDGSNLAKQLGRGVFATRGILICARYFIARGHRVMVFVPRFRAYQRPDPERIKDQHLLRWMHDHLFLTFTPSRYMQRDDGQGQYKAVCYDDNYIVQFAHETGGVIVSNDLFRDVMKDHPEWIGTIKNRSVVFSWAEEMFMVADDPQGRRGPRLNEILRYGPNERPSEFAQGWSKEHMETLLKEIDETLTSPPPQPRPPPRSAANTNPNSIVQPGKSGNVDAFVLPITPRFGFAPKECSGFERYVPEDNTATRYGPPPMGFGHWDTMDFAEHGNTGRVACTAGPSSAGASVAFASTAPGDLSSDTSAADDLAAFMKWFPGHNCRDNDGEFDIVTAIAMEESMAAEEERRNVSTDQESDAQSPPVPSATTAHSSTGFAEQATISTAAQDDEIDPDMFDYFCDIFPCEVVMQVLKKHKNIHDVQVLSNLLADALLSQ